MEFITKAELLAKLRISESTYKEVIKPDHPNYVPDFPKPVSIFTSNKHRYSSVDVDAFILKYSHTHASNDDKSSAA
jgi:predicted DNA-binding transcriptional regulator AlpA